MPEKCHILTLPVLIHFHAVADTKGQGRAWEAERSSTEPFRKKDHATYLGAQRHRGGVGGVAHQQPGTRPPSTSGTPPALCPCWRSACHAPGSHPPASVWLFRTSTRAHGAGR